MVDCQRREDPPANLVEPLVLRRAMVEESHGNVAGLVPPIPRTPPSLLQQQRGDAERAGRRRPHLEHEIQEDDAGIHLPLSERYNVGHVRQVSSESDTGRDLFRSNRSIR